MADESNASLPHPGTAGIAGRASERALDNRDAGTAVAAPLLARDMGSRTEDRNVIAGPIHAHPLRGYLLVDGTTEANLVGIAGLMAITANVWHDFFSLPPRYTGAQDEVGRLRTVLRCAAAEATCIGDFTITLIEIQVPLCLIGPDGKDNDPVTRSLWM